VRWIELFQDVQADHLPAKPLEERIHATSAFEEYQYPWHSGMFIYFLELT